MSNPIVFLIDNGSLRPEATFWLRCLAEGLSERSGLVVEPASLLHSHKVPAEALCGRPATIVRRRLRECIEAGHRRFIFLPLFLGPSLGIIEYLPKLIDEGRAMAADLQVVIADVLAGPDLDQPDLRLAKILADQVEQFGLDSDSRVALVDHGTPVESVNRVRNAVAEQLSQRLGRPRGFVQPCSMERREGAAYAFNEPLLDSLGQVEGFSGQRLILAMFFLLPGRHAGTGGDVAEIYEGLLERGRFKQVETTPLLGGHPGIFEILLDRLKSAVSLSG